MSMRKTKRGHFLFTAEAWQLLTELAAKLGVSRTAVIELAVRKMGKDAGSDVAGRGEVSDPNTMD